MRTPIVDYRQFRFSKLKTPQYNHLIMLLYWPIYGLLFMYVENWYNPANYYSVHCGLDDIIGFSEIFVIPYLFWFVYLVGMLLYTLLYDIDAFKNLMKFIMITYTVTIIFYFIFPTCQELRPVEFERDNVLTRIMKNFYEFDTNTNVCPSIHVIGSLAVWFTSWHIDRFKTPGWRIAYALSAILICVSTVFLKQHSVVDVVAAIPLSLAAYFIVFRKPEKTKK